MYCIYVCIYVYVIGPPIFHDTMKCWSCCKDVKKAYDFESFQLILGCSRGRHSAIAKTVAIAESPNAVQPNLATAGAAAPPPLKSIESYNSEVRDIHSSDNVHFYAYVHALYIS